MAPSASKLKKLKAALDCCVVDVQEYSADPHAIAGGECGGCCMGGALGPKGCCLAPRGCFQAQISPGACTSSVSGLPPHTEQEMLCRSKGWSGMHMSPNGVCSLISAASAVVQDAPCMQSPDCCAVKYWFGLNANEVLTSLLCCKVWALVPYQGRHQGPLWGCAELEGMGCPEHGAVMGMCLAKGRQRRWGGTSERGKLHGERWGGNSVGAGFQGASMKPNVLQEHSSPTCVSCQSR